MTNNMPLNSSLTTVCAFITTPQRAWRTAASLPCRWWAGHRWRWHPAGWPGEPRPVPAGGWLPLRRWSVGTETEQRRKKKKKDCWTAGSSMMKDSWSVCVSHHWFCDEQQQHSLLYHVLWTEAAAKREKTKQKITRKAKKQEVSRSHKQQNNSGLRKVSGFRLTCGAVTQYGPPRLYHRTASSQMSH